MNVLPLVLAVLAAADPDVQHLSTIDAAAWANDGDDALLVCRHERDIVQKRFYFAAFERGYRYENEQTFLEIRARNQATGKVVAVLPGGACLSGFPFHFMRSAGYAIVYDLQVPLDGGEPRRIELKRRDFAGGLLLPSPDGKLIAVLSRPNHGVQKAEGTGPVDHVSILDARDARVLTGPHRLPWLDTLLTWTPAGELIAAPPRRPDAHAAPVPFRRAVRTSPREDALRVGLDGTLVRVARPPCFKPGTSSSEVSRSGLVAKVDRGHLSFVTGTGPSFGCQLPPNGEPEFAVRSALPSGVSPALPAATMRRIEGGSYPAERWPVGHDEFGTGQVTIRPFWLDATPVTVAAYAECVRSKLCAPPNAAPANGDAAGCNADLPERQDHPINCVSWNEAARYCAAAGGRLPTAEELEWAAHGARSQKRHPWGDGAPGDRICWSGPGNDRAARRFDGTCPVDSHPRGKSPQGVLDLVGNVAQWTSTAPYWNPYQPEPFGPRQFRVYGGGWDHRHDGSVLFPLPPDERRATLGFRCARSID